MLLTFDLDSGPLPQLKTYREHMLPLRSIGNNFIVFNHSLGPRLGSEGANVPPHSILTHNLWEYDYLCNMVFYVF